MTAKLFHLSDFAHLKPFRASRKLAVASVSSIADYKLTFSRGWLRYGRVFTRISPELAGDLAESLFLVSSTTVGDHATTSEPAPGLVVTGHRRGASIRGFGPPVRGVELRDLILELQNFHARRARRNRG